MNKREDNTTERRTDFKRTPKERFNKLLSTIFYITDLAGFRIEGRVTFIDKGTGKKYT